MIDTKEKVSLNFSRLVLAVAILVFALIVAGGIMRATESGAACPDWPTCFGQWTPPDGLNAKINYAHRLITGVVTPLVFGAALIARRRYHHHKWLSRPLYAAAAMMAVEILIGAVYSLEVIPSTGRWTSALHLSLSLLIQTAVLIPVVVGFSLRKGIEPPEGLRFHSPFSRLSLATLVVVFVLLISGAVVAGSGASSACQGWPLCDGRLLPSEAAGWIPFTHRIIVALSAGFILVLARQAWRTQRSQTAVLTATTAATVLFAAQALLGAEMVNGFPAYLLVLHEATSTAVWAALVVQVVAVGMSARTREDEQNEAIDAARQPRSWKDFLALTKPVVVALLLVTTFAGMVIGARAWPPFSVVFWTLLGGFLAAGGSGSVNQYIDRYDDGKMQRTQKRPIPSGRLTAGEGLAFGVAAMLASFYIMVAFTNLLAALLSLAGIIYYVLIYSIFLKKTTVQNIVIGGGAGAIPPLVGWAAATGSLNIPSLFLFAVVFMWTPPHFWALALVRSKDYARAGVPMLPVVRGDKETRRQIMVYTVELVGLTLLLPVFGLGGAVYTVLAAILGLWLLSSAWKVWKEGGNKTAWKMYRYSSMYLAFLFLVLMIDRLL